MTTTIVSIALVLGLGNSGQCCSDPLPGPHMHRPPNYHYRVLGSGGWIMPPGPGDGWGFPNKNSDQSGWYDNGPYLPLGPDRTTDYFFPRYYTVPLDQAFMGTYYNPYVNRGQHYIPFTGNGGCHPMGGPAPDTAPLPFDPIATWRTSEQ